MNDKQEFINFIENKLSELDVVSDSTVNNLRIVSNRVLKYIPQNTPYTSWDAESIVNDFSNAENISDSATSGYKTRLRSAISKFSDFKSGTLSKVVRAPRKKSVVVGASAVELINTSTTFALPIPLREGLILNIGNLPLDLTEEEAEKITRIIKSYAVIKN